MRVVLEHVGHVSLNLIKIIEFCLRNLLKWTAFFLHF